MSDICPIWGTRASRVSYESAAGSTSHWVSGFNVESDRSGGSYLIDKQAYDVVGSTSFPEHSKARLTSWLIEQRGLGVPAPKITFDLVSDLKFRKPLSVVERANRLLQYIANLSPSLGNVFVFYPDTKIDTTGVNDIHLMLAISESLENKELVYLLRYLKNVELLEGAANSTGGRIDLMVTPKGYTHLDDLQKKSKESAQGFVAMWFHASTDLAYREGIELGIKKAGYNPVRIDRKDHNNKIDDEIIAEIRRSRFVVADFTEGESGARGGVYYEAGFAHGLNIPVIFTCRGDSLAKVHLDTRQYNHIVWNSPAELSDMLAKRISATIGDGPLLTTAVSK